jgi:hypothetical protein
LTYRTDSGFGNATASVFNPFGGIEAISYDFNVGSVYAQPHFRSKPRISYIRPPADMPFDGTSFNGLAIGVGIVGLAALVYFLGKNKKWWK